MLKEWLAASSERPRSSAMRLGSLFRMRNFRRPTPAGDLPFPAMGEIYERRLGSFPRKMRDIAGPSIGVVVTPWIFTAAPFHAIELAFNLASAGCRVTVLWDQGNAHINGSRPREIRVVERVLSALGDSLPVVDVRAFKGASDTVPRDIIDGLARENAVQLLKGESGVDDFLTKQSGFTESVAQDYLYWLRALKASALDRLVVPGGVWGTGGISATAAEEINLSYTTFDSGPGRLFLAQNGAAAHFPDVSRALGHWAGREPQEIARCLGLVEEILSERQRGEDIFRLQPHPAGSVATPPCDVLLALNYRADTAALCRNLAFEDVRDWVLSVCRYMEARGSGHLVVRQHPCEKFPEYRGTDEWKDLLSAYLGKEPRIRFVSAEDDVNTYDLMRKASVVLPFTSRVGIEAAWLGKAVLLGARCFYRGCGFTMDASCRGEYFRFLDEALAGGHRPSSEGRQLAGLSYYITEKLLNVATSFTPQPVDYLAWTPLSPRELADQPGIAKIIEICQTGELVPVVLDRTRGCAG